ncbi:MAG: LPS-assembly protein LptD, partial [Vicinamibacterales bacterium]
HLLDRSAAWYSADTIATPPAPALRNCMRRLFFILAACLCVDWMSATPAVAQLQDLSSCKSYQAAASQTEQLDDVSRLYGSPERAVRVDCDEMQFFADYIEIFKKQDYLAARGNIVFVSGGNRIAADRAEFNTKTRTGTFYNAKGSALLGERADRSMFGTQEPDAYFWGAEVKKLGPKKYRINNGGFTTCVQPTPRWEISSGSFTINLDEYALLTNAVFRVKGVPLMYLPAFYYPVQEDDRATGFLMPTYGSTTAGGQIISNFFFWAINRSHDATVYHDWLSKAGQQVGGEYRYVLSGASRGNTTFSFLDEKAIDASGSTAARGPRRSYSFRGDVVQGLPGRFRATATADYFSSIQTQQQYQQDLYRATNRTRRFGAHVTGSIGQLLISSAFDHSDIFYTATSHITTGSLPRVTLSRPERPLIGRHVYFGVTGESVTLLRSTTQDEVKTQDQGLTRLDVSPSFRMPFNKWPFLGINTVVGWRGTYWTESLSDPVDSSQPRVQIGESLGRQYFDFQARITGPVFNKIFNPPEGTEGMKFKHVIEPTLAIQRLTAIDQFDRIVKLESTDYTVGNVTRYTYGLTNRLYAKKDNAREVATVVLSQTYYTDANASQYDRQYQSSFTARKPTHYSPVALQVRTSPTERLQAEFRTEWDPTAHSLRTLAANGTYSDGDWLNVQAGWSQRRYIPDLPGFDDPNRADQYVNAVVNLRGYRNRIGGTYAFNYDLLRDRFLHQRWIAYYNAQCCGIGFEYQTFNLLGSLVGNGLAEDRRFNISFTLAGIGTFSNLFGAFGGQQDRR